MANKISLPTSPFKLPLKTSQLSAYAPKARKAFIAAASAQAARLGISATGVTTTQLQGDVLLISGQAFPATLAPARDKLADRVRSQGFAQTMDAIAYTWFNRFVAIRYMELHGYLDHGYRVLSHPEGQARPEILDHAAEIELPGLNRAQAIELKLDGTQDEELYRLLLKAQCNALHQAMPFLFEEIGDETELLLPANLLHTDSLIRQLVEEIDEALWQEIEIIGWLYQFYISEKKDQVIGKVVKSEDIPAATQLFTPNWIVKYMVQNSLGAQWLATYPNSPIKQEMEYYIEPAEQTDEVNAQLVAITPKTLNPEELTLIDPASGSGHILVEAYELFKAIYLERGYRQRDVPHLILEKNLFGLDIDVRAAQLTGFALMMKGRADDRRLFERGVKLNVMALVDSANFDAEALANSVKLTDYGLELGYLTELRRLFEHATTFGSLIQVPEALAEKLPALKQLGGEVSQDLFVSEALKHLGPLVRQADVLAERYDAVVANPPYMGGKGMNAQLRKLAKDKFPRSKSDLFAIATECFLALAKPSGFIGLMTPFTWMFLKSFEELRSFLIESKTLRSLIQPEYHAFFDSAYVPVCTFVLQNRHSANYSTSFIKLADFYGADLQPVKALEAIRDPNCEWLYTARPDEFQKIPGSPLAYWISRTVVEIFQDSDRLSEVAEPKNGLQTSDNDRFLRLWHEVASEEIGFGLDSRELAKASERRWFPTNKGGAFRKWYGNHDFVVNWGNDGKEIFDFRPKSVVRNPDYYFRDAVSWSDVTVSTNAFRYYPQGFIHNITAPSAFGGDQKWKFAMVAYCNNKFVSGIAQLLNPSMHFTTGDFGNLPCPSTVQDGGQAALGEVCVKLAIADWDAYERSWDFQSLPLLTASSDPTPTLESSYTAWTTQNRETIAEMKRLEEENNRLFIDAYGLAEELTPDVPIEQITLTVNPAYRYGGKLTEEELWTRFRQDSMEELISYAIGCMMGRYSLDAPGLVYAHSGNEGFDPTKYTTFPADDDGIVPLTDTEWFDDDACNRTIELVSKSWPQEHLKTNLEFLAANLSPKKNESSRDTLRRYLNDSFFKKHLQTYKKRPIYWLFSSGKQKAFSALVYLHRYNEGTLARMRSEYVIPLQGKMASRLEQLQGDITAATSTAHQKKLEKEQSKLQKQQVELIAFDEKLRHYADRRITLDLDDGVKANYGKFGDLLAEAKAIHGKKPEVL